MIEKIFPLIIFSKINIMTPKIIQRDAVKEFTEEQEKHRSRSRRRNHSIGESKTTKTTSNTNIKNTLASDPKSKSSNGNRTNGEARGSQKFSMSSKKGIPIPGSERGSIKFKVVPGSKEGSMTGTASSFSNQNQGLKGLKKRQLSKSDLKFEGRMSDREAFLNNRKEAVNLIKFSKAGDVVLVGKVKGTLCVWRFDQQILDYKVRLHNGLIYIVEFISNERQVITCDDKGVVKISRIFGSFQVLRYLDNNCYINTGVFCHKKKLLICTGEEKAGIKIWDFKAYLRDQEIEQQNREVVIEQTETESIQRRASKGSRNSCFVEDSMRERNSMERSKSKVRESKKKRKKDHAEKKEEETEHKKNGKRSKRKSGNVDRVKVNFKQIKKRGVDLKNRDSEDEGKDYKQKYFKMKKENEFFKKRVKKYESEVQNLREEKRNLLKQIYLLRREMSQIQTSSRKHTTNDTNN